MIKKTHEIMDFDICTKFANFELDVTMPLGVPFAFAGFLNKDDEVLAENCMCIVRVNEEGLFQVSSKELFLSDEKVYAHEGERYHITGNMNLEAKTLSVYVNGVLIADNYTFRNVTCSDNTGRVVNHNFIVEDVMLYEPPAYRIELAGDKVNIYSAKNINATAVISVYNRKGTLRSVVTKNVCLNKNCAVSIACDGLKITKSDKIKVIICENDG